MRELSTLADLLVTLDARAALLKSGATLELGLSRLGKKHQGADDGGQDQK